MTNERDAIIPLELRRVVRSGGTVAIFENEWHYFDGASATSIGSLGLWRTSSQR